MLEPGGDPDLAQEALRAQGVRELRVQDLDGDKPLVADVVRQVHRGPTPAPDFALEDVAAGEELVQCCGNLEHGGCRRREMLNVCYGC